MNYIEMLLFDIPISFDPESFYEQKVVWGDMDSFQCVLILKLGSLLTLHSNGWIDT